MALQYNQFKAMWAIGKATMRAIFRSPQAVFFSLFFPVVLIVIFGSLGGGGGISLNVAFDNNTDTANAIYQAVGRVSVFNVVKTGQPDVEDRLKKGRITAIINIKKISDVNGMPQYDIHLKTTSAAQKDMPVLQTILRDIISNISARTNPSNYSYATISQEQIPGRIYRMIDFYLPGMLGFSLIGSAIFGVSFLFFSLRETLVLKRMFASPVSKAYIVLGDGLGRILFNLTTATVLILFGRFFYQFTLSEGVVTFLELMFLSVMGLIVFMGFGYTIASLAKNQNVIPIYANLFMFPQYFLSGTFFPKTAMPDSIQWLINILPLTALNDAMRKVSFEGAHLFDCGKQLAILAIWGIVVYAISIKVFKWE
ncbi:MAG TPA: ABC transporter permease [Puia sp.]|nr:ABC transporter permease [Puia sp.]